MSQVSEEDFSSLHKKLIRGKDKNDTFLKQNEFALDIKPRRNFAQHPTELCKTMESEHMYNYISDDIWYLVSHYIPPEHVKTFALICRQSANVVNTKGFWKYLYKTYCQGSKCFSWNPKLPERLQYFNINSLDLSSVRQSVVESFFICRENFVKRLEMYDPDFVLGRTWICAWYCRSSNCGWITSFKFAYFPICLSQSHKHLTTYPDDAADVVDDWESLAGGSQANNNVISGVRQTDCQPSLYRGGCYLLIYAKNYTPLPAELYNTEEPCWRVALTRRLLTADLRGENFEIGLEHARNQSKITLKYKDVTKCKVIPWWHPKYRDKGDMPIIDPR